MSEERDEQTRSRFESDERRRLRSRGRTDENRWAGLGMLGLVGWAFAIPMLLTVGLGIWADTRFDSPFAWSLMAVFVGAFVGGINAWYWVQHEQRKLEEDDDD